MTFSSAAGTARRRGIRMILAAAATVLAIGALTAGTVAQAARQQPALAAA